MFKSFFERFHKKQIAEPPAVDTVPQLKTLKMETKNITLRTTEVLNVTNLLDCFSDAYSTNQGIVIPHDLLKDFLRVFDRRLDLPIRAQF